MKEMTREEFEDRAMALQRATEIFIKSGLTDNLTKAFEAYQAIFAERERQIFMSSQVYGTRPKTIMDNFERVKCPDCGADMMFRKTLENPMGILTQLVCTKCDLVLNDKNDLDWWMKNLKAKR